jgi:hypothetical protein
VADNEKNNMTIAHDINSDTLEPESPCPMAGCQTHRMGPETRAAFAEARRVASLALVRAMAWSACAEDQGASYYELHEKVLRGVRELGLAVSEAQVPSEVRGVADVCCSSPPESQPPHGRKKP